MLNKYLINSIEQLEAKSKRLLSQERYLESLNVAFEVLKRKGETESGHNNIGYARYFCEVIKVFNQVGMQLMNSGRQKLSQKVFKQIIAFLSYLEVKKENQSIKVHAQMLSMLILTLNNLGCCYKR